MTKKKRPEDLLPPSGGAPALYTDPQVMADKIDEYFNSIRTLRPVMVRADESSQYTAEEIAAMTYEEKARLEQAVDLNGNPLFHIKWVVPPREGDLHRYLGMKHRDTWADYQKNPVFSDTIKAAKQIIEDWLKAEASERNSNTTGVQFILRCCYGYKDVQYSKVENVNRLEDYFDE